MEKVEGIKIKKNMKVSELVDGMKHSGFGARKIGLASHIVEKMFDDEECKVLVGLAGAMVPAGMKQILIDLIKTKKVDVLVSTGANLTHDLVEALGDSHYHCDVWDDEEFNEKGYDRMYNVLMKNEVYEKLEKFFEENWEKLKDTKNAKEFLKKIGEILPENSNSILRVCYDNGVDLYCPALADCGIGLMVWGRKVAGKKISIDAFDDMNDLIDFCWTAKKKGVIYINGGFPKNFIQQSLQFSSGADYGVQITTASQESGSSSGAPLEEGKSWGKLKKDANYVDVPLDATVALPLIFQKVLERLGD